jgi:hypothetical protein
VAVNVNTAYKLKLLFAWFGCEHVLYFNFSSFGKEKFVLFLKLNKFWVDMLKKYQLFTNKSDYEVNKRTMKQKSDFEEKKSFTGLFH